MEEKNGENKEKKDIKKKKMTKEIKMIEKEIEKLVKKGESRNLEFKESLSVKEEIGESVSAFSNTCKGIILIGVSNLGKIKGVQVGKRTIEELANYIKQNTDNSIFPDIKVEKVGNKNIIVIEVNEADEKPVFFKGKAYARVGNSNHKLSASEIRKLAKESAKSYWDEQICKDAGLDDIDFDFINQFFIPKYELITKTKVVGNSKELLEALSCINENKPTNAGILLFGKNPQRFFMNTFISLVRYKGKEVGAERLDYKEFTGNLFQQINNCNKYTDEHIAMMSRLHPGKIEREDISEYPLFSIRELIVNAVAHRDYAEQRSKIIIKMFDDRIEYYNPGGLPKGINPKNITKKQFSRNPIIAKVLSKIRYIEEVGEGWDKIVEEHNEHPLKPKMPVISSDEYSITVTLFSTKEKFEEKEEILVLNERQKYIFDTIKSQGFIQSMNIQKKFNVTRDTANRDLNYLIQSKLIKREGIGKSIRYVKV